MGSAGWTGHGDLVVFCHRDHECVSRKWQRTGRSGTLWLRRFLGALHSSFGLLRHCRLFLLWVDVFPLALASGNFVLTGIDVVVFAHAASRCNDQTKFVAPYNWVPPS